LEGINVGFYDEQTTPAFAGIILHKGICRGYAMNTCFRYWKRKWEKPFNGLIRKRSAQTGYFAYQFSRYHVMQYNHQPSLIDLEGIYPIGELHNLTNYHSRFDDRHYESYITSLYNERYHRSAEHPLVQTVENGQFEHDTPFLQRGFRFLWKQSLMYLRKRPKQTSPTHLHLIQK
jgi:hypothetical protein